MAAASTNDSYLRAFEFYLNDSKMSGKAVNTVNARGEHECQLCGKSVSTLSNLNRHLRCKHKEKQVASKKSSNCQYDDCHFQYFALNQYREHLFQQHEIAYATKYLAFTTKDEFTAWLENAEQQSSCRFTVGVSRPKKEREGTSKVYYYCSRSGRYKSRSTGARRIKAQGSCKIGTRCPCGFTLTVREVKEPKYLVEYYPTHLGHDTSLGHTQIPRSVRRHIAEQLSQGVSERSILDEYRSSAVEEDSLSRVHLLTLKDVNNIRSSLGLPHSLPFTRSTQVASHGGGCSLEAWIKTQQALEQSPVLLYKPRDDLHSDLDLDDFILVLMTPFQRRITSSSVHDGVCIESYVGIETTLTVLMCYDVNEQGFPAAFCVSSIVNSNIVRVFLSCVKKAVGFISVQHLMSNDTPMYYEAWCEVMGQVNDTQLSTWHVLNDWNSHLNNVADLTRRQFLLDNMVTCMKIRDETAFQASLSQLIQTLEKEEDEDVVNFKNYFVQHYCARVEAWAMCYRGEANRESELSVTSLHKTLQQVQDKCEPSVVKLVENILAYVNVRMFERIVSLHKSKTLVAGKTLMQVQGIQAQGSQAQGIQAHSSQAHSSQALINEAHFVLDPDEVVISIEEFEEQEVLEEMEVLEETEVLLEVNEVERQAQNMNHDGLIEALNECIELFQGIKDNDVRISDEHCFAMHEQLEGFKKLLETSLAESKSGVSHDTEDTFTLHTEHNYAN